MKTLLLIRHAKSDWQDASLSDFERPLNERGRKDAPAMAERLKERDIRVDVLISSPAKRARKTAEQFSRTLKINGEGLILKTELYLAPADEFFTVLESLGDQLESVAVFAHNPGITDFANALTDARVDNIPTCGIFAVSVQTKKWSSFRKAKKEFLFFDYPKAKLL